MLRLRPMKKEDAKFIVEWVKDYTVYEWLGGEGIGSFPLSISSVIDTYFTKNGLCKEDDNFYPWICMDEDRVVGTFIMRYIENRDNIRFGWVIVDNTIRGKGYGRKMLELGLKYAFDVYGANLVTIGVVENNLRAYKCYRDVGFIERELQPGNKTKIGDALASILELEKKRS